MGFPVIKNTISDNKNGENVKVVGPFTINIDCFFLTLDGIWLWPKYCSQPHYTAFSWNLFHF